MLNWVLEVISWSVVTQFCQKYFYEQQIKQNSVLFSSFFSVNNYHSRDFTYSAQPCRFLFASFDHDKFWFSQGLLCKKCLGSTNMIGTILLGNNDSWTKLIGNPALVPTCMHHSALEFLYS